MKRITSFILVLLMIASLFIFAGCGLVEDLCPHTFGELETVSGKAATCTESGLTEGKKCPLCGGMVTPQEALPSLGHAYKYHTETDAEGNRINVAVCQRENCGETTTVSDKERLIGEWREAAGINEGDIDITIGYYVASLGDSCRYPLNIKISDGNIYFSKKLYENVEYIKNHNIYLDSAYFNVDKDKIINGEKVSDTIEKIKNSDGCYMITVDDPSSKAYKIAVFKVGEYYYFFSLYSHIPEHVFIAHSTNFKDGIK